MNHLSDHEFLMQYTESVGKYLQALDNWENALQEDATPNYYISAPDRGKLPHAQQEFLKARDEINRGIRRATQICNYYRRVSPFSLLLNATLNPPPHTYFLDGSQITNDVRMRIRDCLIQTLHDT